MSLSPKRLAIVAAWLLSLVAAVFVGALLVPTPPSDTPGPTPATPPENQSTAESAGAPAPKSPAGRRRATAEITSRELAPLLRDPAGPTRTRQLLRLLDTLPAHEFPSLVDRFRNDPLAPIRQAEYDLILSAWADLDPYAAAEYLEASEGSGRARETVIATWAARDPEAARLWTENRADDGNTNNWVVGLVKGFAASEPRRAISLVESLAPGHTQSAALKALAPHVADQGGETARDWLDSLPTDGPLTTLASRELARALAHQSNSAAASWVEDLSNPEARRVAARQVAHVWAGESPSHAMGWAENLPPDTLAPAAEGITREVARQDPLGTSDWLNSLGETAELDPARRAFLSATQGTHPSLALDSVGTLTDPDQQERYYSKILTRWAREDAASAQDWVSGNADLLPPQVLRRYEKHLADQ